MTSNDCSAILKLMTLLNIIVIGLSILVAVVAIHNEQLRHNKLMEEVVIHEKVEKTFKRAEADHK